MRYELTGKKTREFATQDWPLTPNLVPRAFPIEFGRGGPPKFNGKSPGNEVDLHRKCLSLKFAGHCVIFNGDLKPFIIFFRFAKSN